MEKGALGEGEAQRQEARTSSGKAVLEFSCRAPHSTWQQWAGLHPHARSRPAAALLPRCLKPSALPLSLPACLHCLPAFRPACLPVCLSFLPGLSWVCPSCVCVCVYLSVMCVSCVCKQIAREAAAGVGLEPKLSAAAGELSGGQRRKLSVAIAFMGSPAVVFLVRGVGEGEGRGRGGEGRGGEGRARRGYD